MNIIETIEFDACKIRRLKQALAHLKYAFMVTDFDTKMRKRLFGLAICPATFSPELEQLVSIFS